MDKKEERHMSKEININGIVFAFQNGNELAGEEILKRFGGDPSQPEITGYLKKYYELIRSGTVNFENKEVRKMMSLFFEDEEMRRSIVRRHQKSEVKKAVVKMAGLISTIMSNVEDDDLKQDLRMLLLKKASIYKKTKASVFFTGYLSTSFYFDIKNYIDSYKKSSDVLVARYEDVISLDEDKVQDESNTVDVKEERLKDLIIDEPYEELGVNWIHGITSGDEFKDLTKLQRMIIKLYYQDGYTDKKISNQLCLHINTIFNQRKKACLKIEAALKEADRNE